ncbi:MAG: sulfatase-like hydrolase/transferase [Gammaproteobacteria bacterium]
MESLTILVCTHNRVELLSRALESLNACTRPTSPVRILVAANACTDGTVAYLQDYQAHQEARGLLPLDWIEEPTPGKSHALNTAIPRIESTLVAMVDDDHRIDAGYLVAVFDAAEHHPEAGLYCGRILPDWDGSEPAWVHDEGPYKIYPLPVPRYDQGAESRDVTEEHGPIPGGGNLVVRRRVFAQTGRFSTELGPRGHDLGGGEDSEYVLRALNRGETCRYFPAILQYHYVDVERLKLGYLLRKSYQRTRSIARLDGDGTVPPYVWRKLIEYAALIVVSMVWQKRRFYLMRMAAALGELRGRQESGHRRHLPLPADRGTWIGRGLAVVAGLCGTFAMAGTDLPHLLIWPAVAVAFTGTVALVLKSLRDFSQTGPRMREEILRHYRRYTFYALARLGAWTFAILLFLSGCGMLAGGMLALSTGLTWTPAVALASAVFGILAGTGVQFARKLRGNPGLLLASMHYRPSRLYRLWAVLTPGRQRAIGVTCAIVVGALAVRATHTLLASGRPHDAAALLATFTAVLLVAFLAGWEPTSRPARRPGQSSARRPNILMIGSDTLRADRLGSLGYRRMLTPHIDALAAEGTLFTQCYVPCARTAPSLISLFTGTWPHRHGIRDNFAAATETRLRFDALPTLLKELGYRSAVISDWCGADMGKFSFGFDHVELPADQWNLKYLIRQGPKDLRLFLSLFLHNRLGRLCVPELYYLGGAPLTTPLGRRARRLLSRLAATDGPFLLNVFYSTTHPPFASEWPWYTRFGDEAYRGESKFAMARLTDPFEIIRRQGAPREEFDLDRIIDLYDSCVAQFDDEVGRMLAHLDASGLAENTIVVIYSDHGMEFFEHDAWGQGNSAVGEASPRVPLVMRVPGAPPRAAVESVVRSIDVAPTLLELAGGKPRDTMDGVSLAAMVAGGPCPALDAFNETGIWFTEIPGLPRGHLRYPELLELLEVPDRVAGTISLKPEYRDVIVAAKDRMIRRGHWKLVLQPLDDGAEIALFDVSRDPDCRVNVARDHPDIARELHQALVAWMDGDAPARAELAA